VYWENRASQELAQRHLFHHIQDDETATKNGGLGMDLTDRSQS